MAKPGEGNFFLKHVEKMVLAICLVVLAGAVYSYVLSEATATIAGVQTQALGQIDAMLLNMANQIATTPDRQKLPPEPDYAAELAKRQEGFVAAAMPDMTTPALAITAPEIQHGPTVRTKFDDIVNATPAPEKPLVKVAAELRNTEPQSDVLAAHVTALYSCKELLRLWGKAMLNSIVTPQATLLDVQAEVQEQLADGNWSDPRPVPVNKGVAKSLKDVKGNPLTPPIIPESDGANGQEIQNAIAFYHGGGANQVNWDFLKAEPDYWDVLGLNHLWMSWRINLPWTELSDKVPAGSTGSTPGHGPMPGPYGPGGPLPGGPGGPMMGPGGVPSMAPTPTGPRSGTGAGARTPARGGVSPVAVPAARIASALPENVQKVTPVLNWAAQLALGKIQVWIHDDSLEHLKVYRYHIRLAMLNPLYAKDTEIQPVEAAKTLEVDTPWSEWSDAVAAPREAYIFLTGSSEMQKMVSVTVFTRYQGQRVKQSFNVKVGDRIGHSADVDVADLDQPGKLVKKTADFSTGAVLIGIDWNRTVFRSGIAVKTVEIAYLDEQGKVQMRTLDLDRISKEFADFDTESRQIKPAAPPGETTPVRRPPTGGTRPPTGGTRQPGGTTPRNPGTGGGAGTGR